MMPIDSVMQESVREETKRLVARVVGRVQGVGFRAFVRGEARKLGLTGWVRNEYDDSVQVIAEGPAGQLNALLALLRRGPNLAFVHHVDADWRDATGEFASFEIRR